MEDKPFFRISLFGYKKKDVNSYIEQIAIKTDELIKQTEQRAKSAEDALEHANGKISEITSELSDLKEKNNELLSNICELQKDNNEMVHAAKQFEYEIGCLKDSLSVNENELNYEKSINDNLTKRMAELECEVNRYIGEKVKIADSVINSRYIARKIIDDANVRALQVREQVENYLTHVKVRMDDMCADAEKTRSSVSSSVYKINDELSEIFEGIDGISVKIDQIVREAFKGLCMQAEKTVDAMEKRSTATNANAEFSTYDRDYPETDDRQ